MNGNLNLECGVDNTGRSYIKSQYFTSPFHISKPYWDGEALLVQITSPTPGLFGGDKLTSSINILQGSHVIIANPSATRAHTMRDGKAKLHQTFSITNDSILEFFPSPLILQKGSKFYQRTDIDIKNKGKLIMIETLAPGRIAHGESFEYELFDSELNLQYNGTLVARERFRLEPKKQEFNVLKIPFTAAYYSSAYVINKEMNYKSDWINRINSIQNDKNKIGVSKLVNVGWNIKLLSSNSLENHEAIFKIRNILMEYFSKTSHQNRMLI